MYYLSKRSKEHLKGVNPKLIELLLTAIEHSPYDFGIPNTGGYRTPYTQNCLFRDNKSKCDGFVKLSKHQSGNAFDIYAYVDGKASWDYDILTDIAIHIKKVAKNLGIELVWGGNWKNYPDLPHFQLK
jgi:peptidoglycan L-alanyl-D-glutamate endopeptidase CwlK